MVTVTRTDKGIEIHVDEFTCGECDQTFYYTFVLLGQRGFPEFCPECGVEFDHTEDETRKEDQP